MNHFCTDGVYTPGYDPISSEGRLQTLIPTPWYPRGSVSDLLTQGCDHIWPLCIVMSNFCTDGVYTLGYVSQYKIDDFSYISHVMKRFGLRSHVTLTRDRVHNYVHMTRECPSDPLFLGIWDKNEYLKTWKIKKRIPQNVPKIPWKVSGNTSKLCVYTWKPNIFEKYIFFMIVIQIWSKVHR